MRRGLLAAVLTLLLGGCEINVLLGPPEADAQSFPDARSVPDADYPDADTTDADPPDPDASPIDATVIDASPADAAQ